MYVKNCFLGCFMFFMPMFTICRLTLSKVKKPHLWSVSQHIPLEQNPLASGQTFGTKGKAHLPTHTLASLGFAKSLAFTVASLRPL